MAHKNSDRHPTPRATKHRKPWFRDSRNWLVVVMLAFVVAVVAFKLGFHVHPEADIDRAAIATAELSFPEMKEIERQFVCPCGRCGELELEVCECDGPGGAMEMKTTIARALRSGSSVDEIVAKVSEQYGGLKPLADRSAESSSREIAEGEEATPDTGIPLKSAHHSSADPSDLLAVISAFDCPCGNCALTLVECTCDHARGAVEVKGFIKARLEAGLSTESVIDEVDQKYGGKRFSIN